VAVGTHPCSHIGRGDMGAMALPSHFSWIVLKRKDCDTLLVQSATTIEQLPLLLLFIAGT